jgi:hypothetical protein
MRALTSTSRSGPGFVRSAVQIPGQIAGGAGQRASANQVVSTAR